MMNDTQTDNLSLLLSHWLDQLKTANASEHTIYAYANDVNGFIEYIHHASITLQEVDVSVIQSFVNHRLEDKEISPNSLQRELSALRQFYAWLIQHAYLASNPFIGFKIKRRTRKLPEMVDIDVISQLLDQPAPSTTTKSFELWLRDKAMLELIYSSGLRVAELVALTVTDIDLNGKQLTVQAGKGNKTRIVPIGKKAIDALQVWLHCRETWLVNQSSLSAIFISKPTKKNPASPITTRTVQRRIQHHAQRAGIEKRLYPHLLRHCFASHLLSGSGDLRAVQELLGHENISTTQIYTHLDFEQLSKVYDNSHPRAKK